MGSLTFPFEAWNVCSCCSGIACPAAVSVACQYVPSSYRTSYSLVNCASYSPPYLRPSLLPFLHSSVLPCLCNGPLLTSPFPTAVTRFFFLTISCLVPVFGFRMCQADALVSSLTSSSLTTTDGTTSGATAAAAAAPGSSEAVVLALQHIVLAMSYLSKVGCLSLPLHGCRCTLADSHWRVHPGEVTIVDWGFSNVQDCQVLPSQRSQPGRFASVFSLCCNQFACVCVSEM